MVENKPGASGNIGTQQVARAAPDGHTLLMAANTFVMNASLFKSLPYDPQTELRPDCPRWRRGRSRSWSIPRWRRPTFASDSPPRQGSTWSDQLRLPGARHPAAYDHGAVQAHRRRLADARALFRLGRCRARPRRRPCERDVPAPALRRCRWSPTSRSGCWPLAEARVGARPRHADAGRAGRRRLRCRSLVRHAGARRHERRNRCPLQYRDQRHPAPACGSPRSFAQGSAPRRTRRAISPSHDRARSATWPRWSRMPGSRRSDRR